MRINPPIGAGEFFDKLTILVNKVYLCEKKDDLKWAIIGLVELASADCSMTEEKWNTITHGLHELRDFNKWLWDLEEQVRKETDSKSRLQLSDKIRELNAQRSEVKDVINIQLDSLCEVKDYGNK